MIQPPPDPPPLLPQVVVEGVERRQIRAELAALEEQLAQYEQNFDGQDGRIREWLARFQAAIGRQEDVRPLMHEFGQELRILLHNPFTENIVRYLMNWLADQNQPPDEELALVREIEARHNGELEEALLEEVFRQEAELIETFEEELERAEAFREHAQDEIAAIGRNDEARANQLGARIDRLLAPPNPRVQELHQEVVVVLRNGIRAVQERVNILQAENARLGGEIAAIDRSNTQLNARITEAHRKLEEKNSGFGELFKAVAIIAVCIVANEVMGQAILPHLNAALFG